MTTLGVFRDDFYNAIEVLPQVSFSTTAVGNATVLLPAQIFGGQNTVLQTTVATALTLPSAALMWAAALSALPNPVGVTYILRVNNTAAGLTLTAGAGGTLSTGAVPAAGFRDYAVTIVGPTSYTMQSIGSGTN